MTAHSCQLATLQPPPRGTGAIGKSYKQRSERAALWSLGTICLGAEAALANNPSPPRYGLRAQDEYQLAACRHLSLDGSLWSSTRTSNL
ncbi:unnamed protein product [Pieris brassicae]|uniref:Uncharacterized protein n=1 Tax=Pieris brassicae TaxID=7116 RepID=A0A9P0XDS6_PIEBR|nr:unnamed protein product [Pieris brassicae]